MIVSSRSAIWSFIRPVDLYELTVGSDVHRPEYLAPFAFGALAGVAGALAGELGTRLRA